MTKKEETTPLSAEEVLKNVFGHAYGTLHPLMHVAPILRAMELYASQPSPQVEDRIEDEETFHHWLTPKIDGILNLHDTFLKTFPDREDEADTELKLCIRAGIMDIIKELKLMPTGNKPLSTLISIK